MDFLYKPPQFIKAVFPGIIWNNSQDRIVLTIDDGPSENTFRILDGLERHKLKAIFFCTGKNIEKHFNEFNAIIKSGHRIENHGYSHKRLILR
ncbi:MAG: polysaccharide deacetylase family protein, partial [Candidatus Delongbacteria bacterium]|nr:polysaccharide deacetylase family protein [Candidatus Delongbacteria bacterium]